mmetsp:Transcript_84177/g.265731  ORF Transcript_84177/g.265731 Transcript_84177/m.265731 type:complete len:546 (+) Transcript_84177:202-1839(+)
MADFSPRGREPTAARREPSAYRRPRDRRCVMKILTPQMLAAAVIGRGGSTISEMERTTQAAIGISKVNEVFPRSYCRVLTAFADSEQALNEVARQVLELVLDIYFRVPSQLGADENQLRIGMLVPKAVITSLIASEGSGVRAVCEASGAMVKILDPVSGNGPDASQEIRFRGKLQELEMGIREMNREVQLVSGETWFHGWAHSAMGVSGWEPSSSSTAREGRARSETRSMEAATRALSPEWHTGGQVVAGWKVLAPSPLAEALEVARDELEERHQATLRLSEPHETYPLTRSRFFTVRVHPKEPLNAVVQWIIERLAAVAASEPDNDDVTWDGRLKLSFVIPSACAARLMGKGGSTIRQLSELTGVRIWVQDKQIGTGPDAAQKVDLKGSARGLEQVLVEVNGLLDLLREEAWFEAWAAAPTLPSRKSESKGPARAPLSPAAEAGMELVGRVMEGLPSYVLEESRGFATSCVVPCRLMGAVVGRSGTGLNEVQRETKTRIVMRPIPGDDEHRTMTIAGPLLNVCSAYMLMMKRYLDAEKEDREGR